MSTKPTPVALTAAYLARRAYFLIHIAEVSAEVSAEDIASLASSLHRLLPALKASSLAQCNGEEYDGQRDFIQERIDKQQWTSQSLGLMTERIEKRAAQLTRRIAKLSEQLRPYGLFAYWQADPRGAPLYLVPIGEDDYSRGFCVGG